MAAKYKYITGAGVSVNVLSDILSQGELANNVSRINKLHIQAEGGAARIRLDGVDASSDEGMLLPDGSDILFDDRAACRAMRCYVGDGDFLNVHYWMDGSDDNFDPNA